MENSRFWLNHQEKSTFSVSFIRLDALLLAWICHDLPHKSRKFAGSRGVRSGRQVLLIVSVTHGDPVGPGIPNTLETEKKLPSGYD